MFDSIRRDIWHGFRVLIKTPGFASVAVLTLGLGIGINSTVFTWLKGILLNPLPGVENADRLVTVHPIMTKAGGGAMSFSYPDYLDYSSATDVLSGLAAYSMTHANLGSPGHFEREWGMLVSANYFDVLGVKPHLGRGFVPAENKVPLASPVVVLSYNLWHRRFSAEPKIVGQSILLNNKSYTVIGVAPSGFWGSFGGLAMEFWTPMMMASQLSESRDLTSRGDHWFDVMGRLKPGVSVAQAQANLESIAEQLAARHPDSNDGVTARVFTLLKDPNSAQSFLLPAIAILTAVAALVLLIACANVASLLLARAASRSREIAVRLALGAGRWRLIRQLLTETLVVASIGGAAGLVFAYWAAGWFSAIIPDVGYPVQFDLHLDGKVLLFAIAATAATAALSGLVPALQASRLDLIAAVKEGDRAAGVSSHRSRLRGSLVSGQVALSVISLIAAGLLIRTLVMARSANGGFNPDNVLLASVDLFSQGYDRDKGLSLLHRLDDSLRSAPGIQSVTFADRLPLRLLGSSSTDFTAEGYSPRQGEEVSIRYNVVGPDYFKTLRIPLVQGRGFEVRDDDRSTPVIVINETLARRYFSGQDPVGKYLISGLEYASNTTGTPGVKREIIGVIKDVKEFSLGEPPEPYCYIPIYQFYRASVTIIARTSGDPWAALAPMRDELRMLDSGLPVFHVTTLVQQTDISMIGQSIAAKFLLVFGALALALAGIGLYGVMAYSVSQRKQEIGIRMSLGASPGRVIRLIMKQGMVPVVVGMALGFGAAVAVTRLISSLLIGVSATDPLTFAGVGAVLLLVALLAILIPTLRACKIDPIDALRYE
jgi:predicted permease